MNLRHVDTALVSGLYTDGSCWWLSGEPVGTWALIDGCSLGYAGDTHAVKVSVAYLKDSAFEVL